MDIYSYRFLRHQGFSAIMTGCPAWYDLNNINVTDVSSFKSQGFSNICVSEPAKDVNLPLLLGLLGHLRDKYPSADITLVNHREVKQVVQSALSEIQEKQGIQFVNISGSVDGFSVYDKCDLHVGFRVHAHIYNLSKRNQSILFSEDIRGAGVNQTLGLENMTAEEMFYGKKRIWKDYYLMRCPDEINNPKKIAGEMFDDYLETCSQQNFNNYESAFKTMKKHFQIMKEFFDGIKCVIK